MPQPPVDGLLIVDHARQGSFASYHCNGTSPEWIASAFVVAEAGLVLVSSSPA